MAPIDLDNYRITLQDKLDELTSGNRDRESLAAESAPDEMDQTRGRQERDMAVEVCNRDAKLLGDLRFALKRISTGTFGICTDCELDINQKRLTAVPWAEMCIVCQQVAENMAGQCSGSAEESLQNAA